MCDKCDRTICVNDVFQYLRKNGKVQTKTDLAKIMGANRSSVSRALNGDPQYLNDAFLFRLNAAFGNIFNMAYLMRGEGDMLAVSDSGNNIVQGDNNHHFQQSVSSSADSEVSSLRKEVEVYREKIRMLEKMVEDKDKEIDFLRQLITNR